MQSSECPSGNLSHGTCKRSDSSLDKLIYLDLTISINEFLIIFGGSEKNRADKSEGAGQAGSQSRGAKFQCL